jgi:predicted glycosyltransferase
MTNEAAVLGTPALRYNSFVGKISYLKEQEVRFKLAFGFKLNEFEIMTNKISELLVNENLKEEWFAKRKYMLSQKIDTTKFLVELIDNYSDCKKYITNDTDYFDKFR